MTFADRMEELRRAATGTPWAREGHSRIPEISMNGIRSSADADYIAFLANHADAILELVRAADMVLKYPNVDKYGFTEALTRLASVPKKKRRTKELDYKKRDGQSKAGAVGKPRRLAGKSDPAD